MKYKAIIEYLENSERAGKLSITNENGVQILSKIPVAIPESAYISSEYIKNIYSTRAVIYGLDEDIKKIDKKNQYSLSFNALIKDNPAAKFIVRNSEILFYPTLEMKMKTDINSFVLHQSDFEKVFSIVSDKKNILEIETKKVSFLWFPEKVENSSGNINKKLILFEKIEDMLKSEMNIFTSNKELEDAQRKSKLNIEKKLTVSEALQKVDFLVTNEERNNNEIKNSYKENKVVKAIPTNNIPQKKRVTNMYDSNDNVDALDVVLMYNCPELAPFMKPNSMLAWYFYFENQNQNINKNFVENNINNVVGFENISSSDFKYTSKGYSVSLYENDDKNTPTGHIEYDKMRNCYEAVSVTGEKSYIKLDGKGNINGCIFPDDSAKSLNNSKEINFNFVETKNGFIGNWEANNQGVALSSGIVVSPTFESVSTVNEKFDLSKVLQSNNNLTTDYSYKFSEPENKWEPPPPPPPQNNDSWSSSDPYNNTSSFRP